MQLCRINLETRTLKSESLKKILDVVSKSKESPENKQTFRCPHSSQRLK